MTLCFYRVEPKTIELPPPVLAGDTVAPPSNMYVAEAPPLPKATLKSTTGTQDTPDTPVIPQQDKNIEDNTLFA